MDPAETKPSNTTPPNFPEQTPAPLPPKPGTNRMVLLVIILMCVLVAAAAILFAKRPGPKTSSTNKSANPSTNSSVTLAPPPVDTTLKTLTPDTAPTGFPSDIPIEQGAQMVGSYSQQVTPTQLLVTRIFISKKTAEENFNLYKDYLTKAGWLPQTRQAAAPVLYLLESGKSGNQTIRVIISQDPKTSKITVSIIYITKQ